MKILISLYFTNFINRYFIYGRLMINILNKSTYIITLLCINLFINSCKIPEVSTSDMGKFNRGMKYSSFAGILNSANDNNAEDYYYKINPKINNLKESSSEFEIYIFKEYKWYEEGGIENKYDLQVYAFVNQELAHFGKLDDFKRSNNKIERELAKILSEKLKKDL